MRFWWDDEDPKGDIEIYIFPDHPTAKVTKNILKMPISKARDHWRRFVSLGYKRERIGVRSTVISRNLPGYR